MASVIEQGGRLRASGRLTVVADRASARRRAHRREVRAWRIRQFFRQGWREFPLRAFLKALPVVKWILPGLNVQVGRLYARKFTGLPSVPEGWTFVDLVRRGDRQVLLYDVNTENVRGEVAIPVELARGHAEEVILGSSVGFNGFAVTDYGLVGVHLVTTAGKNYDAGGFDGTNSIALEKFHAFGTGTTAPTLADTTLQTELTTQYATGNTRPTGSQAHSTNTYTTIATLTPSAGCTVTEWGLLTQAATGGGTLKDRQTFTGVGLSGTGDSLQTTYVLTLS
jgi:hypothetical protein